MLQNDLRTFNRIIKRQIKSNAGKYEVRHMGKPAIIESTKQPLN